MQMQFETFAMVYLICKDFDMGNLFQLLSVTLNVNMFVDKLKCQHNTH